MKTNFFFITTAFIFSSTNGFPYSARDGNSDLKIFQDEMIRDLTHTNLIEAREDALTYDEAVTKGRKLWEQLSGDCYMTKNLEWKDLDTNDFEVNPGTKVGENPSTLRWRTPLKSLVSILSDLELNVQDRLWTQRWATRFQNKTPVTLYGNNYSPKNGVIIAQDTLKTAGVAQPLTWSDATWLIWVDSCQKASPAVSPSNLQYIIRHQISNAATIKIVQQAYGVSVDGDASSIAGKKTWDASKTNKDFLAMLGTANGRGVAWLLIDHGDKLNGKKLAVIITQTITVENDEGEQATYLEMIFKLAVPSKKRSGQETSRATMQSKTTSLTSTSLSSTIPSSTTWTVTQSTADSISSTTAAACLLPAALPAEFESDDGWLTVPATTNSIYSGIFYDIASSTTVATTTTTETAKSSTAAGNVDCIPSQPASIDAETAKTNVKEFCSSNTNKLSENVDIISQVYGDGTNAMSLFLVGVSSNDTCSPDASPKSLKEECNNSLNAVTGSNCMKKTKNGGAQCSDCYCWVILGGNDTLSMG